jgi:hypothetical protein
MSNTRGTTGCRREKREEKKARYAARCVEGVLEFM